MRCRYIQVSKTQGPEGEATTYHFAEQVRLAAAAAPLLLLLAAAAACTTLGAVPPGCVPFHSRTHGQLISACASLALFLCPQAAGEHAEISQEAITRFIEEQFAGQ